MNPYGNIIRPTQDIRGNYVLDMRISNKSGQELAEEISKSVDHTQKFIVTEVPNQLIVTQKQFASLNNYTDEMFHTTDRMFRTGSGFVLEVQISDEIDTIKEIDETIKATEAMKKEREETNEQTD